MIGEMLGEVRGQIIGNRVLPVDWQGTKVESSFQGSGKLLGLEVTDIGTYWSVMKSAAILHGEGQGVTMTKDGETASWKGHGVGKFTGRKTGTTWRGAIFYQTTSAKLARLNSIAVVFEFEVDENGNTTAKFWEWK